MGYQDKWVKGSVERKGYRECQNRYDIIRNFCIQEFGFYTEFTVLDIGANWSYFGLRLTEDFTSCRVVGIEPDNYPLRIQHLRKSHCDRIALVNMRIRLSDFDILSSMWNFDLVLALSVIHHMAGKCEDLIRGIRSLGDIAIIELATDDSPRSRGNYKIPDDAAMLGDGVSHKSAGAKRPIFMLRTPR